MLKYIFYICNLIAYFVCMKEGYMQNFNLLEYSNNNNKILKSYELDLITWSHLNLQCVITVASSINI